MRFSKKCKALLKDNLLRISRDKRLKEISKLQKERSKLEDEAAELGLSTPKELGDRISANDAKLQKLIGESDKGVSDADVDKAYESIAKIYADKLEPAAVAKRLSRYDDALSDFVLAATAKRKIAVRKKVLEELRDQKIIKDFNSYIRQFKPKDAEEGILGYLAGTNLIAKGSRKSIDFHRKALANSWTGQFTDELESQNLLDFLKTADPGFRRHIMKGLYEINHQKSTGIIRGEVIGQIDENAYKIAQIIYKWQNVGVNRLRRNGAIINNHPSYLFRTAHDQKLINDANQSSWRAKIKGYLDPKSYEGRDEVQINEFLDNLYTDLRSGNYIKIDRLESNDLVSDLKAGATGLETEISRRNRLIFKDADSHMDYLEEFGRGSGDILDSVIFGFEHNAATLALSDALGSNPKKMLQRLVSKVKSDISKKDPGAADKFRMNSEGLTTKISNVFAELDGTTRSAVNVSMASFFSTARLIKSTALLGRAALRSVSDLAFSMAEARFQGIPIHRYIGNVVRNHFSTMNSGVTKRITRR